MALEIITTFRHSGVDGEMTSVHVTIRDKEFFWSDIVTLVKEDDIFGDRGWRDASINYGFGGHQSGAPEIHCVRVKGEALLRAAEIAEELDRLWPRRKNHGS